MTQDGLKVGRVLGKEKVGWGNTGGVLRGGGVEGSHPRDTLLSFVPQCAPGGGGVGGVLSHSSMALTSGVMSSLVTFYFLAPPE